MQISTVEWHAYDRGMFAFVCVCVYVSVLAYTECSSKEFSQKQSKRKVVK